MLNFVNKNFYRIFQFTILILFILPILAPIFARFGPRGVARVIYFVYSFSCHQLAHRSLHIYDYQCAWCTRDTFIWGGILLSSYLVPKFNLRNFKIYWLIPFVIPIALDGGLQTIATMLGLSGGTNFYTSTNFTRAITGGIFGIGMGIFLSSMIYSVEGPVEKLSNLVINKNALKIFGISISVLSVFYLLFIQVWNITSKEYKPDGFLDLTVRTTTDDETWIRQAHGLCEKDYDQDIMNSQDFRDFVFLPSDCF